MATVDEIKIVVQAEVDSAINKMTSLQKTNTGVNSSFAAMRDAMLGPVAVAKSVVSAAKAVKDQLDVYISSASDAEETTNKFSVVYSTLAGQASAAAKDLAKNYGLSSTASEKMLSDTGDLLAGLGVTQEQSLELSETVAKLGVDLASFSNYAGGTEGAVDALRKAMLGETEQAKGLGLVLGETQLAEYAKANGLVVSKMTLAEKAQARLNMAIEQSPNAIGDFARSMNSYANQTRIAEAASEDLKKQIGIKLFPVATNIKKAYAEIASNLADYIKKTNELNEAMKAEGTSHDTTAYAITREEADLKKLVQQQASLHAQMEAGMDVSQEQINNIDSQVRAQRELVKSLQTQAYYEGVVATEKDKQVKKDAALKASAEAIKASNAQALKIIDGIGTEIAAKFSEAEQNTAKFGDSALGAGEKAEIIRSAIEGAVEASEGLVSLANPLLQKYYDQYNVQTEIEKSAQDILDKREKEWEILLNSGSVISENTDLQEQLNKQIEITNTLYDASGQILEGLGESFVNALQGEEDAWESLGDAAKSVISSILSALGQQYFVKAAEEIAAALAAMANPLTATEAAAHYASAGKYTAAGALAYTASGAVTALAEGGIVKKTPGGINAIIGEGNYDEAVIPLKNGANGLGTSVTVVQNIQGSIWSEKQLSGLATDAIVKATRGW